MWWAHVIVWVLWVVLFILMLKVEKIFYEDTSVVWGGLYLLLQTLWTLSIIGVACSTLVGLYYVVQAMGIPL